MSQPLTMDAEHTPVDKPSLSVAAWLAIGAAVVGVGLLIARNLMHHEGGHGGVTVAPPGWYIGIVPFIGILGCIAILPLLRPTHHWWESNLNRLGVALVCAGLTVLFYLITTDLSRVLDVLENAVVHEYLPFIVLLFCLYVISGGIALRGDLAAHPVTNTAFLAAGAVSASFIGTTGASMLLIRPLLATNSERRHVVHTVIFFIFLVSNIGGTLLPIGDPPLFLGYLRGVPFFWTFGLWKEWLFCCTMLLVVYFIWDTLAYRREFAGDLQRDETRTEPLRLRGAINLLWLLGVVLAVAFVVPHKPLPLVGWTAFPWLRELLMLAFVGLSLWTTPKGVREMNRFNYAAIIEVAALFIGIFIAMQVPLDVLRAYGPEITQTLNQPWHFYWMTGSLSSFLDNAPTYLVFFELGGTMDAGAQAVVALGESAAIATRLLVAISLGAVFMGSMTYIGNGPNFMVKAIAEQSGVRMPSFFGYMFMYSIPILIPLFIAITILFL